MQRGHTVSLHFIHVSALREQNTECRAVTTEHGVRQRCVRCWTTRRQHQRRANHTGNADEPLPRSTAVRRDHAVMHEHSDSAHPCCPRRW